MAPPVSAPRSLTVGIDVGGTFTDLLAIDSVSGEVKLAKVPTTIDNQAIGFMAALAAAGADPATLQAVVHGTTTTTNALLERKIAKVGLITTRGFRDVLELGRRTRPQAYGLRGTFRPLIERELRLEVPERMDADGKVLVKDSLFAPRNRKSITFILDPKQHKLPWKIDVFGPTTIRWKGESDQLFLGPSDQSLKAIIAALKK